MDEAYGFDAFGNLISYAGRVLPVLGSTNRLSAAGYDASGNITSWADFSYTWDVLNQLIALQGNGLQWRFGYTASGERILEWDVVSSRYTLSLRGLQDEVLREVSYGYSASADAWQVFWEKDWVCAGSRLVGSVSRTEGIQQYHVDHLGSPRMVTNRCGQRVEVLEHNPRGLDRFDGVQDGERHRFTGQQRDLGLLDRSSDDVDSMHARYYLRYLGRFFSVDPGREFDPKRPQSVNLYAFVSWQPQMAVDPLGLYEIDFHFYAVYYLARSAGFPHSDALMIAWASQYVDDSQETSPDPKLRNLVRYLTRYEHQIDAVRAFHFHAPRWRSWCRVWDNCTSPVTRENEISRRNLERARQTGNLIALGIALHSWADTFAHEGFVAEDVPGVNRRENSLRPTIGHADAPEDGRAPDRPYNDVQKALQAASSIYSVLRAEAAARGYSENASFGDITPALQRLFRFRADLPVREELWRRAILSRFRELLGYDSVIGHSPGQLSPQVKEQFLLYAAEQRAFVLELAGGR